MATAPRSPRGHRLDPSPAQLRGLGAQLARQLAERAREEGLSLTGPDGLLGRLTKVVLEGALEGEMDAHLKYARHDGRDGGNSRNGYRAKTVVTDVGQVQIEVPRDRDASFEPKIVAKRQRRLPGARACPGSLIRLLSAVVGDGAAGLALRLAVGSSPCRGLFALPWALCLGWAFGLPWAFRLAALALPVLGRGLGWLAGCAAGAAGARLGRQAAAQ
jgi:Transposase, Mutator family